MRRSGGGLGGAIPSPGPAAGDGVDDLVLRCRGDSKGGPFELEPGRYLVGRPDPFEGVAPDLDLEPVDTGAGSHGVSRRHAELEWRPEGGWRIVDLGSRNGTWVGEHRLVPGRPVGLARGDRIAFGRLVLVVERAGTAEAPAAANPAGAGTGPRYGSTNGSGNRRPDARR